MDFLPHILDKLKLDVRLQDRFITNVNCEVEVDAPHSVVFDLLADPDNHTRIFRSIEGAQATLISESGPCKTRWNFWKVNGVCENKVLFHTDSSQGLATFHLREPGFLKVYEGTWSIMPAPAKKLPGDLSRLSARSRPHSSASSLVDDKGKGSDAWGGRTLVSVEKRMAPKIQPPYPLNLALKCTAAAQVKEMLQGIITAALRKKTEGEAGILQGKEE
jgi:hypothetical protein